MCIYIYIYIYIYISTARIKVGRPRKDVQTNTRRKWRRLGWLTSVARDYRSNKEVSESLVSLVLPSLI